MNLSLWDVSSRLMSIVVYMVMCVCVLTFSVDLPISDTYACVCVCLTLDPSLLSLSVCGQRISLPLSSPSGVARGGGFGGSSPPFVIQTYLSCTEVSRRHRLRLGVAMR